MSSYLYRGELTAKVIAAARFGLPTRIRRTTSAPSRHAWRYRPHNRRGDHRDTLSSRNSLAGAYQSAGDLGRAISLYEQTLADRQRVLAEQAEFWLY
jgi:Tetratricopeptide repeat